MSELPEIHPIAINVPKRLAVAEEGVGNIRVFLDIDGDETHDPQEGVFAVVEWLFGGWSALVMAEFNRDPS